MYSQTTPPSSRCLRPGATSLLFPSEGLLLSPLTVIDSYKLLCQSARKSIMENDAHLLKDDCKLLLADQNNELRGC